MKFSLIPVAIATLAAQQVLASGPVAGCLQTHVVVAGDSCDGIAATFKITPDEFYAMLCDNLDDGKKYCVCTKKPCVAEPAGAGNSTSASASGAASSAASSAAQSASSNVASAVSASASASSSSAPSSSSAASSSSSSSSNSSSAASASASGNKPNGATSSAPATALALSVVAIAAVVLL
ncbi:hypothetical protein [Absidia glauca]|uniref:LysM domain-containing protein n=1 Tax=Absidia glauca TaxID=4829 RepID=A0A163KFL5_ABSGL|nr:hypothetical protein [Absidia glauca]